MSVHAISSKGYQFQRGDSFPKSFCHHRSLRSQSSIVAYRSIHQRHSRYPPTFSIGSLSSIATVAVASRHGTTPSYPSAAAAPSVPKVERHLSSPTLTRPNNNTDSSKKSKSTSKREQGERINPIGYWTGGRSGVGDRVGGYGSIGSRRGLSGERSGRGARLIGEGIWDRWHVGLYVHSRFDQS